MPESASRPQLPANLIAVLNDRPDVNAPWVGEILSHLADGNIAAASDEMVLHLDPNGDLTFMQEMVRAIEMHAVLHKLPRHLDTIIPMLRAAVDVGILECAYNVANHLAKRAKSPEDYKVAARYYQIAMKQTDDRSLQAAAHVNYCEIVRDGLITGKPDWPQAVVIYGKAGDLGLVRGMTNAGNVCAWIANSDVSDAEAREYAALCVYWSERALAYVANGSPRLTMDDEVGLMRDTSTCRLNLAAMNIDDRFERADLERGIQYTLEVSSDEPTAARFRNIGVSKRLQRLAVEPSKNPGENWRAVLRALGWSTSDVITQETFSAESRSKRGEADTMKFDCFQVRLTDGTSRPFLVGHDAMLPSRGGFDDIEAVAEKINKRHLGGYFMVPRKGYFVRIEDEIYTPVVVADPDGGLGLQSLYYDAMPEDLIAHLRADDDLETIGYSCQDCMISIAVNALDEGLVIAADAHPGVGYVDAGDGWCMPFVRQESLLAMGIVLRGRAE